MRWKPNAAVRWLESEFDDNWRKTGCITLELRCLCGYLADECDECDRFEVYAHYLGNPNAWHAHYSGEEIGRLRWEDRMVVQPIIEVIPDLSTEITDWCDNEM